MRAVLELVKQTAPKVTAADIAAAATRLLGTVIHDVAGVVSGAALYVPRLEAFASIDDATEVLGEDDGSIVVLVLPGTARDLIAEHGTPGRAAAAINRELRAEWSA